jgi:hypothetical protein
MNEININTCTTFRFYYFCITTLTIFFDAALTDFVHTQTVIKINS